MSNKISFKEGKKDFIFCEHEDDCKNFCPFICDVHCHYESKTKKSIGEQITDAIKERGWGDIKPNMILRYELRLADGSIINAPTRERLLELIKTTK